MGYPLMGGVRDDYAILHGMVLTHADAALAPLAALSYPLDLVIDVVLLPLDLLAGVSGLQRSTTWDAATASYEAGMRELRSIDDREKARGDGPPTAAPERRH